METFDRHGIIRTDKASDFADVIAKTRKHWFVPIPTEMTPTKIISLNDWTYGVGSGNTGLTTSKLVSAMLELQIPEEDYSTGLPHMFVALHPVNVAQIWSSASNDTDRAGIMAVLEGKIDCFLGFNFIKMKKLPRNTDGHGIVYAFRMMPGCEPSRVVHIMCA
jgi:hypothetical protein